MAHLHFKRTPHKSGNTSASQRIAYITRQPVNELSRAAQQLAYIRDDREDLVYTNHRNLPDWARDGPHGYFAAAERHEGAGRNAFEEWKITLPHELSHRENMLLTKDLVQAIAKDTLPIVYAFHDPPALSSARQQPHLHLLISARKTDEIDRTPEQHFKRYNRAHPERGGAEKDAAFYHMGSVKAQRVMVSDIINTHLEQAGHTVRVHPETLESRQIDRTPEPKLLPSESRQYREQGRVSPNLDQVFVVRVQRARQLPMELDNASTYWEARKHTLGITHDRTHAQRLERITQARERLIHEPAAPRRVPVHELAATAKDLQQSITSLERYVVDVQVQHIFERSAERDGRQRTVPEQWRAERVLAAGTEHGLPRDPEAERVVAVAQARERQAAREVPPARQAQRRVARGLQDLAHGLDRDETPATGSGLRVRLHEPERERDEGMDLGR